MSISPLMTTYPPPPVTFVRGSGTELWDDQGRRYLDFLSGLAVTSLGHAHPAVAEAVAHQSRTLLHVSNLFANDVGPEVARTLDRLIAGSPAPPAPSVLGAPGAVSRTERAENEGGEHREPDGSAPAGELRGRVFFANSGAEANECAFKLARRFGGRGRHVVVSALGSFHGRTLATLHATGQPAKHELFQPLPEGFRHVEWADLDALAAALDRSVAAVILEPVQGEGGVNPAPPGYFAGVRQLCDERGILFVVDEVQTGLARTGEWFGFQHFDGVVPDVVTMAKALGNGVPISACWAKAEVAEVFQPGDHATTFGGQPLAAAAARAVLATMEAIDAPGRARHAGALLTEALSAVEGVTEVRGLGLLLAAQLDAPIAADVTRRALDAGLVLNAVTPSALRLAPPLTVADDEIAEGVDRLAACIAAARAEAGTPA